MPTQRIAVRIPRNQTDPDAQAFITAAGITDTTQKSAINTLVVNLKAYGIWTKMKALYPMVGGTAAQHKWNLKDPRDLDVAFRLQFNGGWTHSANGALPNGTNAFANTFFNSSVNGQQNSQHISYYSKTNSNGTEAEMGGIDASSRYSFIEARTSGISYYGMNQPIPFITHSDSDSRAFYIANRTASNVVNAWKNGIKTATGTNASASTNVAYQLGAVNNLVVPSNKFYSTKQCAFASIGDGLTDTEAANFYTAVQAYQTTLGRAVIENQILNLDAGNSLSYPGTGTTWTDLSGNGYNGTLNGGVTYSSSNGGILIYDGIDDNVTIPLSKNALANVTGKWTIQFWVYISGSQSNIGVFQMAQSLSSGEPWLFLQRQNNTTIRWFLNGGYRITQTITTDTWYNLALNYDGTIWRVYTNGVQEATTYTGAIGTLNATSLYLANGYSGYLNGRMPQIQAYTTNLSAAQILQNYNNQKTRYI